METGNRLLMWLLFGIILASTVAAFLLEYQAKQGAIAFIGLASTALGVLSPSPFQTKHGTGQSVEAPNAETVNVSQPVAPPPVADPPPAS